MKVANTCIARNCLSVKLYINSCIFTMQFMHLSCFPFKVFAAVIS